MVSLSNHMSGVLFKGPLTPFDKLRVSGQEPVFGKSKDRVQRALLSLTESNKVIE